MTPASRLLKYFVGPLLLAAVAIGLLIPHAAAAPSSGHAVITATLPDRIVAGTEARLTIAIKDRSQQLISNAPVQVRVEMAMAGMAGMNHGNAGTVFPAKAGDKPGEYIASIKLADPGDWRIVVVSGDSSVELKATAAKAAEAKPVAATAVPQPAPNLNVKVASGSLQATSMEAVHASFLELTANISDLRSRVDLWKKGDGDSLKIAQEKLERIQVGLVAVTWPSAMGKAVITTTQAIAPMERALAGQNVAAAETAAKALGDGSHDVVHTFYGDYLAEIEAVRFSPMALHAIYLDLAANIADLLGRAAQWQKGDEASLNIAKEKVQRIEALAGHLSPSGMLLNPMHAVQNALPGVTKALDRKDVQATTEALKPISEASHELTHQFYAWVEVASGGSDVACVLASYGDLSLNMADLRTRVGQWEQGDEDSYKIAQEKLERVQLVVAHPTWPGAMSSAIDKIDSAAQLMAGALEQKNVKDAQSAAKTLGDGSHDLTHQYYGDWLPSVQLSPGEGQIVAAQGETASGGHGHADGAEAESSGPDPYFVGTTLGLVALTIVMVPILRRRDRREPKAEVA